MEVNTIYISNSKSLSISHIKIPHKSLMLLKFDHRQCLTDLGNGIQSHRQSHIDHYSWITTFPHAYITSFKLLDEPQNVYNTPH